MDSIWIAYNTDQKPLKGFGLTPELWHLPMPMSTMPPFSLARPATPSAVVPLGRGLLLALRACTSGFDELLGAKLALHAVAALLHLRLLLPFCSTSAGSGTRRTANLLEQAMSAWARPPERARVEDESSNDIDQLLEQEISAFHVREHGVGIRPRPWEAG